MTYTNETEIHRRRVSDDCTVILYHSGKGDYRMTGGYAGDHRIWDSTLDRAMAHFSGYWENNVKLHAKRIMGAR